MRDLIVATALFAPLLWAFRAPWIGLMVWVVVSILNPHRFTYGFAYSLPYAIVAALITLFGVAFVKTDKRSPWNKQSILLILLLLWMCVTTAFGFSPKDSFVNLNNTFKVYLMIIVAGMLLVTEKQIKVMIWVLAFSIGIISTKGGIFTVLTGGSYRVWGPPDSIVEDNNAFAVAAIMTVPLLMFLTTLVKKNWHKRALQLMALFSIAAALGSQSRGALLSIIAMTGFLILKGKNKARLIAIVLIVTPVALAAMPPSWFDRMHTIKTYDQDESAMGRVNAWYTAFHVANDRFTGGGFDIASPYVFQMYAPEPTMLHAAHSIYFQVLGEHGWLGLILFLSFWVSGWFACGDVIKRARGDPACQWIMDLTRMIQVSLMAFAIGGAFLSIAYFDMPYYEVMVVVAMRRFLIEKQKSTAVAQKENPL